MLTMDDLKKEFFIRFEALFHKTKEFLSIHPGSRIH